jgi:hypothetical protein
MTKRSLALLLTFLPAFLWAQTATVAGKFPYQGKVPYSISHMSNQIIVIDEWGKVRDTSNNEGFFQQKIELTKNELLSFKRVEGVLIYLRPGDSLWLEMISVRNVQFGGTAGRENSLLWALENGNYDVPRDKSAYFNEYSSAADSLHELRQKLIAEYEASGGADPDFVSLFSAKGEARFIRDKISIREQQLKTNMSDETSEKVSRQLRSLTFLDELRAKEYLEALEELFELEVLELMGYDFAQDQKNNNGDKKYPPDFHAIYQQHWQERLQGHPALKSHFEATRLMQIIFYCQSAAQMTKASEALALLERDFQYPTLHKVLSQEMAKKKVMYHLQKLPNMDLKNQDGQKLELEPSSTQTDVYVFWDAQDTLHRKFYSDFQITMAIMPEPKKRYIWVQMGPANDVWRRVIDQVAMNKVVKHVFLENQAQVQALKPYLVDGQKPISFHVDEYGQITQIRQEQSRLAIGAADNMIRVGNRFYMLYDRE